MMRGAGAHGRQTAMVVVSVLGLGCSDSTAPSTAAPPYLAIVAKIDAAPGTPVGTAYAYRVRSLSAGLTLDTTVSAAPSDTVILSLKPATYSVEIGAVPPTCLVREGAEQEALIPPQSNTTVVRYRLVCRNVAAVVIQTDSAMAADTSKHADYIYRLTRPDGGQQVGIAHPIDTLRFDGLGTGVAIFELLDIGGSCDVVSDGGEARRFAVDSVGGAHVEMRITCSAPVGRPSVVSVRASYHDGALGFVLQGTDPDARSDSKLESYTAGLTDCHRTSLSGKGPITVGPFSVIPPPGVDTVQVVGAFEVGLPDATARAGCLAVWFTDRSGNISPIVEAPLGPGVTGPRVDAFNARFNGETAIQSSLVVSDLSYLGAFEVTLLRNASGGTPGNPVARTRTATGYVGTTALPDIPLGSPPWLFENCLAVILYAFDANGNFTRIVDGDLFN